MPATAVAADPMSIAREAVKKVTTIATLPEVTAKIISTVENPNSTAAALHKIVAHDPALVTRILKVVNSAFYGLPGQIGSIERAIVLLGLNAVKNIAVAASIGQLFRGSKLCDGYTAKDLWTHCIATAVAARDITRQMKQPWADEAFLCGMIHDIGLLISLQLYPEQLRQVCEQAKAGGNFAELEKQIIGIDHQMLGLALCEQWKFPRTCQMAAGYHHAPQTLPLDSRLQVALVYIADTISCKAGLGFPLTAQTQVIDPAELKALEIDPAFIEKTTASLPQLVKDASASLSA
jgi:HD-like signal output (HDOD) protein